MTEDGTNRQAKALLQSRHLIEGIINAIPARVFWKDKDLVLDTGPSRLLIEEPQTTPEGNCITLLTSKVPLRDSEGEVSGVLGTYLDVSARARAALSNQDSFAQLQQEGYVRHDDMALEASDGRRIDVEFVSNVYLVNGDRVIQCNIRDISERRRSDEAQARLATAVAQSGETFMITDTEGSIVYANPAFEKTTGYTCEEAVGRNARILRSGHHDAKFYRRMWTVLGRGEVWRGHLVNARKDGTVFEEDATIAPVRNGAGRVVNYVAVKRDVTNERSLEQPLLQAQKMEAVGRLAGGVAHDFNNLLGVIVGYGEIVERRLAEEDPLKEKMAQILRAAERGRRPDSCATPRAGIPLSGRLGFAHGF